jgi:hypothetical protein
VDLEGYGAAVQARLRCHLASALIRAVKSQGVVQFGALLVRVGVGGSCRDELADLLLTVVGGDGRGQLSFRRARRRGRPGRSQRPAAPSSRCPLGGRADAACHPVGTRRGRRAPGVGPAGQPGRPQGRRSTTRPSSPRRPVFGLHSVRITVPGSSPCSTRWRSSLESVGNRRWANARPQIAPSLVTVV